MSQAGSTFVYTGAGDILFNLPDGTAGTAGTWFSFINTTGNILKLNTAASESIDDSDDDEDYEIYTGAAAANAWPWSSCTIMQVTATWWHLTTARGDWTTTGTVASGVT